MSHVTQCVTWLIHTFDMMPPHVPRDCPPAERKKKNTRDKDKHTMCETDTHMCETHVWETCVRETCVRDVCERDMCERCVWERYTGSGIIWYMSDTCVGALASHVSDMYVQPISLWVTFSQAQSSKLERLFCHVSVKRDVRALSFELWYSIRKCHPEWDWLYPVMPEPVYQTHTHLSHMYQTCIKQVYTNMYQTCMSHIVTVCDRHVYTNMYQTCDARTCEWDVWYMILVMPEPLHMYETSDTCLSHIMSCLCRHVWYMSDTQTCIM